MDPFCERSTLGGIDCVVRSSCSFFVVLAVGTAAAAALDEGRDQPHGVVSEQPPRGAVSDHPRGALDEGMDDANGVASAALP